MPFHKTINIIVAMSKIKMKIIIREDSAVRPNSKVVTEARGISATIPKI